MRKVSFGRRTVYNLARKQRRPSELYGDGMALLLQTLVVMDFLPFFFFFPSADIPFFAVSPVSHH